MELTDIQCLQVGSFEEGGKSPSRYYPMETILAVAECCFAFSLSYLFRDPKLRPHV
jgi:hypothetical protein